MKTYKTFGKSHSPRLEEIDYTHIQYPVHIIIGTNKRTPIFSKSECAEILIAEIERLEEPICAWCLMPDHLHVLINPEGEEKNLLSFVKMLKGRTARRINELYGKRNIWQESFYDHILRKDEGIKAVSLYILNNPVRKGVTDEWQKYPYSWSRFYSKEL